MKRKTSCNKGQSYKKSFLEINFWNLKKQIRLCLSTAKKTAIAIEEILRRITKGDHNELWSKRETSQKKLQEGRAWSSREGGFEEREMGQNSQRREKKEKHLEKNYRQNKKREGDLHSGVCEEFSPPSRRCSKLPRDPNSEKLWRKWETEYLSTPTREKTKHNRKQEEKEKKEVTITTSASNERERVLAAENTAIDLQNT